MEELKRWLAKLAKRNRARPELFEALLTGRYRRYAYHRLRFMLPRIVIRLLTQFFEVFVLSSVLPWEYFMPLVSYRATTALVGGTYWGALEELRTRVRELVRKRHFDSARIFIEGWLLVALLLALLSLGGVAVWSRYASDPSGLSGFTLFDAYASACFVRLALEIFVRTYHAGIFALTRVYRPFATILLPDLLELALVIAGWNRLGPWGLPASIVVAGVLRSGWTYHYARKAYGRSRLPPPRLRGAWRARHRLGAGMLGRSIVHAIASASSQIDSLLILTLAQASIAEPDRVPLAVVYYVLRPVMGAAHGWTRVFYFDWKRLQTGGGQVFQPRMRDMVMRVGVAVVTLVGALLAASGYALWRVDGLWHVLTLLPLFVARAAFSVEQLEAFSLGHYSRLARLVGVVVCAVLALSLTQVEERDVLLGSAATLLGAVLWSMRSRRSYARVEQPVLGLAAWLVRLSAMREPVRVLAMCGDRQIGGADRLVKAADFPPQQVGRAGRSHVIAFATPEATPSPVQVAAMLAGAVNEFQTFEAADGRAAVSELVQRKWFMRTLAMDLTVTAATRADLIRDFCELAPCGHVLELDKARLRGTATSMSWEARRIVLREISSRAAGRRPRQHPRAPFRVAVLASRGVAEVVFIAPRDTPGFARFMHGVEHASLLSALK